MRLFEFPQVLTLLGCFVLLLLMVDLLSRTLRARLKADPVTSTEVAPTGILASRYMGRWLLGFFFPLALLLSLPSAGLTLVNLLQSDALGNFAHFARSLFSPELSASFLGEVVLLARQTVSISVVGAASGAILGLLLALPATRLRPDRHESLKRSLSVKFWIEIVFWFARMLLNLLRSIPELVMGLDLRDCGWVRPLRRFHRAWFTYGWSTRQALRRVHGREFTGTSGSEARTRSQPPSVHVVGAGAAIVAYDAALYCSPLGYEPAHRHHSWSSRRRRLGPGDF